MSATAEKRRLSNARRCAKDFSNKPCSVKLTIDLFGMELGMHEIGFNLLLSEKVDAFAWFDAQLRT